MSTRTILYFQCLDDPLDASFGTPLDTWLLENKEVTCMSLDSQSMFDQFHLANQLIAQSVKILLVVDSRNGSGHDKLAGLINTIARSKGTLYWIGDHPFASKAIAMTNGLHVNPSDLSVHLERWINES